MTSAAENTALASERTVIESYMEEHGLETALNDCVNEVVKARPADPYLHMAEAIRGSSETANAISSVEAREVLNDKCEPSLEVEIVTVQGSFFGSTSMGPFDEDETRFGGKGLRRAAETVKTVLTDKLVGLDVVDQAEVDKTLKGLAGSEKLPANGILAASIACCRAGAKHVGVAVFEHVSAMAANSGASSAQAAVPMPVVAVAHGGVSGLGVKLPFESICVIPILATSVEDALDACAAVQRGIPQAAAAANLANCVKPKLGARGGYALDCTHTEALTVVVDACRAARDAPGYFKLAVDAAAPNYVVLPKVPGEDDEEEEAEVVQETEIKYNFDKFGEAPPEQPTLKSAEEANDLFVEILANFPVVALGDPFDAEDVAAFMKLKERLDFEVLKEPGDENAADGFVIELSPIGGDDACTTQLMGDLTIQTAKDLAQFDEHKTANTLVLTLTKGQTVSGCVELAAKAKARGWAVVAASESSAGDTDDAFAAHLAVGIRAGQFKAGGLCGTVSKYNELLRIATSPSAPQFIGPNFRAVDA